MAPTAITQALEDFLEAAWHRTAVLNRTMMGLAQSNLKFGFELARAKTLSDVLSLQADYWLEQFNALQAKDVCDELSEPAERPGAEMLKPRTAESAIAAPRSAEAGEPTGPEPLRPQAKAAIAASPAPVVAPAMPKQTSARKPARKASAPAPQREVKSAKGRTKPEPRRPSSNEARASERKGRARGRDGLSPSGTDKVQFGMLDGNAVRFTSAEAWALLEGAWRKVSVDEVLSDAVVLSQARFDQLYPESPELPAAAFRLKDKQKR
jgi:hypothetical protein